MSLLKHILDFFYTEKTTYSHRNRTIEIIAEEDGLDIDVIKGEVLADIESKGRVEAISNLRKRFYITLSAAWRFVDKVDK